MISTLRSFPLHIGRLLAIVAVWNLLFGLDLLILGPLRYGFFGLLACAGFAVIFLTAPLGKPPGSWLVKDEELVWRCRWIYWYIALLAGGGAVSISHQFVRDGFVW